MRRYHEWEQALGKDVEQRRDKRTLDSDLAGPDFKLAQGDPVAAQALLAQVPLDFSPVA